MSGSLLSLDLFSPGCTVADFPYRDLVVKYCPELELHGQDNVGVPIQFRMLGRVAVEALLSQINVEVLSSHPLPADLNPNPHSILTNKFIALSK